MSQVIFAALAYVTDDAGRILTVSRRDNPMRVGLPGGKCEPHERNFPHCTAMRELCEETGLEVITWKVKPIFTRPVGVLGVEFVATYEMTRTFDGPRSGPGEPGLVMRWQTPAEFLAMAAYPDWVAAFLQHIGRHP